MNDYYNMISKEQFSDLIKGHFNIIKPNDVDSYFMSGITGKPINCECHRANEWWEQNPEDEEMYRLLENLHTFQGELLVVTRACWFENIGAFKVNSVELKKFVENHQRFFKYYFFDGDTLIINFELKLVWLFHHEGVYAFIDHNQI